MSDSDRSQIQHKTDYDTSFNWNFNDSNTISLNYTEGRIQQGQFSQFTDSGRDNSEKLQTPVALFLKKRNIFYPQSFAKNLCLQTLPKYTVYPPEGNIPILSVNIPTLSVKTLFIETQESCIGPFYKLIYWKLNEIF